MMPFEGILINRPCGVCLHGFMAYMSVLVGYLPSMANIFYRLQHSLLYPIYITHSENPSPYVRGVRRSGVSPEFRGGKNGIICARARSSVYVTELGSRILQKTIVRSVDG